MDSEDWASAVLLVVVVVMAVACLFAACITGTQLFAEIVRTLAG